MMKFNERFSADRDDYGWTLIEKKLGKNKEGEAVERKSMTFYTGFEGVCNAVIDRSLGRCETLVEALEALKDVKKFIASEKASAIAILMEMEK